MTINEAFDKYVRAWRRRFGRKSSPPWGRDELRCYLAGFTTRTIEDAVSISSKERGK